jgi:hypothetical protein
MMGPRGGLDMEVRGILFDLLIQNLSLKYFFLSLPHILKIQKQIIF